MKTIVFFDQINLNKLLDHIEDLQSIAEDYDDNILDILKDDDIETSLHLSEAPEKFKEYLLNISF